MCIYLKLMLALLFVLSAVVMNVDSIVYATNTFTETSSVTSKTTVEGTNATKENSIAEYYVVLTGFLIIAIITVNVWHTKDHSSTMGNQKYDPRSKY